MDLPNRKANRVANYDYSSSGAYFITICTAGRIPLFRKVGADIIRPQEIPELTAYGKIAETAIEQIASHYPYVRVDKYCIMPDHIHMILMIEGTEDGRMASVPTVSTIVGSMKRWISKQIEKPIWQKSFYDRIIRNEQEYQEIWNYIDNNPLQWQEDAWI